MTRFSIGDAVGAGFSLIKRRPLSVFVWGLLTILPAAAAMSVALPTMGEFIEAASRGDPESAGMSDPMAMQMLQFQGVMGLTNAVRLVLGVIIYTAIVRAVVRPKESSFFSIRVGMDELRVFVVSLALIIGVIIGCLLLVLLGVAAGNMLWPYVGSAKGLVVAVLVIAGILGCLLLGGRLSLLVPATVRYRTFAFAEGWKLGKGKSWALVGVMLLLFLIIIGIEIVVGGIMAGVMFTMVGHSGFDFASLESGANPFEHLPDMARANWPWLAVAVVVAAMLYGMLTAILTAPFASVVRQLSESDAAPAGHGHEHDAGHGPSHDDGHGHGHGHDDGHGH